MKKMSFPYLKNGDELHFRTVLVEKLNSNYSFPEVCCVINGISIYTDRMFSTRQDVYSRHYDYILTAINSESIKTDSAIIQEILICIQD